MVSSISSASSRQLPGHQSVLTVVGLALDPDTARGFHDEAIAAGLTGKASEFTRNGNRIYLPVSGI